MPVLFQGPGREAERWEWSALGGKRYVVLLPVDDEWCWVNHGQGMARLAERGGLSLREIVGVIERVRLRDLLSMAPTVTESYARITRRRQHED